MADERSTGGTDQTARAFSRALARQFHAVGRFLVGNGGPDSGPQQQLTAADSAVVDVAVYVDGVRQPPERSLSAALAKARGDDGFVWLGLKEPDAAELASVAETFGLHELPVEDAVKSGQRPKVERYPNMTFVTLRTARYVAHDQLTEDSEVVETGDVMMFIGEHFVITVRHGEACRLDPVRSDLEQRPELLKHGPWAVAYGVYDRVVDVLLEVSAAMEEDVAAVEDSVFARHGTGRIQRIYQLKRELMEFKRAVLPQQRPLAGIVSGQLAEVPPVLVRYFRDVNDHLTRTVEHVVYFDDVLNSILQARLAQVSVDQNNDMRKIAAWAGIATVWTAGAGIYGMNFDNMPELRWTYGYPCLLALLIGASITMYRAFRRSGWL